MENLKRKRLPILILISTLMLSGCHTKLIKPLRKLKSKEECASLLKNYKAHIDLIYKHENFSLILQYNENNYDFDFLSIQSENGSELSEYEISGIKNFIEKYFLLTSDKLNILFTNPAENSYFDMGIFRVKFAIPGTLNNETGKYYYSYCMDFGNNSKSSYLFLKEHYFKYENSVREENYYFFC